MAEIKRFWICTDPTKLDGSYDHYFEDPAMRRSTPADEEENLIAQLGPISEGHSIHGLVRIYMGTGQDRWEHENTKVYDDFGSAKADATKRMAKVKKQYEAKKKKTASNPTAAKVAARFKGAK